MSTSAGQKRKSSLKYFLYMSGDVLFLFVYLFLVSCEPDNGTLLLLSRIQPWRIDGLVRLFLSDNQHMYTQRRRNVVAPTMEALTFCAPAHCDSFSAFESFGLCFSLFILSSGVDASTLLFHGLVYAVIGVNRRASRLLAQQTERKPDCVSEKSCYVATSCLQETVLALTFFCSR